MSTAGQGAAPRQAAVAQAGQQTAQQTTVQPASQPAPAAGSSARPARRSSTPARLRLARLLATGAALLTGVVATGTFDTDGVNATPNVVASQWQAAERTSTELAAAQLEVAGVVARGGGDAADVTSAQQAFADRLASAAESHAQSGVSTSAGLVDVALAGDAAIRAAGEDQEAAAAAYSELRDLSATAIETSDRAAEQRADALTTGSRSVLTSVVGSLATLLLAGLLVWLALVSRRIVNVPLLAATAITGSLTYLSLNPAALPVSLDEQVVAASTSAQSLQDVRLARAAQYAQVLGLGVADDAVKDAGRALPEEAVDAWASVEAAQADLADQPDRAAMLSVLSSSDEAFRQVESQLSSADGAGDLATGTAASLTAGLALALGVAAAVLAWAGISQRLRDYR